MNRFKTYWEDSLNLLLGLFLLISPWLLEFTAVQNAATNAYIVGAIIVVMSLGALYAYEAWEERVSGVLGIWLMIAPWVLGFSGHGAAMLTHLVIGLGVVLLAWLAASEHYSGHPTT